jgi:hypothetical protein
MPSSVHRARTGWRRHCRSSGYPITSMRGVLQTIRIVRAPGTQLEVSLKPLSYRRNERSRCCPSDSAFRTIGGQQPSGSGVREPHVGCVRRPTSDKVVLQGADDEVDNGVGFLKRFRQHEADQLQFKAELIGSLLRGLAIAQLGATGCDAKLRTQRSPCNGEPDVRVLETQYNAAVVAQLDGGLRAASGRSARAKKHGDAKNCHEPHVVTVPPIATSNPGDEPVTSRELDSGFLVSLPQA